MNAPVTPAHSPRTLKEAVDFVYDRLLAKTKEELQGLLKENVPTGDIKAMLHHGLGTQIRNELLLWSPETRDLRGDIWANTPEAARLRITTRYQAAFPEKTVVELPIGRDMHADDASSVILDHLLIRLRN